LHNLFDELQIEKGEKIAIMGRNTSHWAIAYVAIVTYGGVVVPILPDFKEDEVLNILEHSESVLALMNDKLFAPLENTNIPHLKGIYSLVDFNVLQGENIPQYAEVEKMQPDDLVCNPLPGDVLGVLSYTSGTSGFSKGVMLTAHNLYSNVQFGLDTLTLKKGGEVLSFLPLAHAFGCAFEFLWPFCAGAPIHFVEKIPSPSLLVKAFKEIRPAIIFMVPLIIEKIYKKQLQPVLESPKMRILLRIPILKQFVYKKIRKKLTDTFGGNFYQMIIGGAALNPEVEAFLQKIGFPFTVGYGMTECAPLISYVDWKHFKKQSCGKVVHRMQMKIDSDYAENHVGEILVKGENVMLGYYKNEDATKEVLRKDGWLRTGDLGIIDKSGLLFIRGRSKNMILGASGQNIYPEEIEATVNNVPMIMESVVVDDDEHRIVALVYPDPDYCAEQGWDTAEKIAEQLEDERKNINAQLPAYKQIFKMVVVDTEFEKTPKRSIKRYLYNDYAK
ncbi:MAG: long-chain fatty acid--CoA ligase, partial [Bacteroidia bacterium]